MTPIKALGLSSLPRATSWWRQHGLADRLDVFRACRYPTPRQRSLERTADGSVPLGWNSPSSGTTQSLNLSTAKSRDSPSDRPLVLVSACLLSYAVTYRGTHTSLPAFLRPTPVLFLTEVLFKELGLVQCVPVCPEVQWLGLPAPRVPLRLVRGPRATDDTRQRGSGSTAAHHSSCTTSPSLPMNSSGSIAIEEEREVRYLVESASEDHVLLQYDAPNGTFAELSPSLQPHPAFLAQFMQDLKAVDGIILKSYSPSCGVLDARLYEGAVTPPPLSLCEPNACNACGRAGKRTSPPVAGQRPAASTSAKRPFDLVDGFFTQQLRNFLASMHSVDGERRADSLCHPEAAAPVITCDRLLTDFYVEERGSRVPLAGNITKQRIDERASEAAPNLTSLEGFMESVLQHRDWRLSRDRC